LSYVYRLSVCVPVPDLSRYLRCFPTRRSSDLSPCPGGRPTTGSLWPVATSHSVSCHPSFMVGGRQATRSLRPSAEKSSDIGLSPDRKSTRLNSSHRTISYAVFCLKKKKVTTGQ